MRDREIAIGITAEVHRRGAASTCERTLFTCSQLRSHAPRRAGRRQIPTGGTPSFNFNIFNEQRETGDKRPRLIERLN